jgi:hypothetical protein
MFTPNKYTKIYLRIVEQAKDRTINEHTESHHIIPKSMGGSNRKDNLVRLTVREHYICHLLLTKMTTGVSRQKMFLALDCFTKSITNRKVYVNSRVIAQARTESAQYLSELRKGSATRPIGTYNHSAETKAKQSVSAKGIIKRPAGFKHDSSTVEKMRNNRKGKGLGNIPWNKGLEQVCPHCGKHVKGTLNRWHGDRCKFNVGNKSSLPLPSRTSESSSSDQLI